MMWPIQKRSPPTWTVTFLALLLITSIGLAPITLFANGALPVRAEPTTHYVRTNGTLASIAAAVDGAAPGDIIIVEEGVYEENVTIMITNPLRLSAQNATLHSTALSPALIVRSADVVVEGLTVRSNAKTNRSAVLVEDVDGSGSDTVTLSNLTVTALNGTGVTVTNSSSVLISNCRAAATGRSGVNITDSDTVTVEDCLFERCQRHGVELTRARSCIVRGSTVEASNWSAIVVDDGCEDITLRDNLLEDTNSTGIFGYNATAVTIENNTIGRSIANGIYFLVCSYVHIAANRFVRTDPEVNGYPAVYLRYCDNSSIATNTFDDCGSSSIFLLSGTAISVAENNFERLNRNAVAVYQSSTTTILSNQISGNTSDGEHYPALSISSLTGGRIENNSLYNIRGSGIDLSASAVTVANNSIDRCAGSGVIVERGADANRLVDNTITNCSMDGIAINSSDNTIARNAIVANHRNGVVLNWADRNLLRDNSITQNYHNGVEVYEGADNEIRSNDIANNSGAGLVVNQSTMRAVTDTVLRGNVEGVKIIGGGVITALAGCTITNNTLYGVDVEGASGIDAFVFNTIAGNGVTFYSDITLEARYNWWGSAEGPDETTGWAVTVEPWLEEPPAAHMLPFVGFYEPEPSAVLSGMAEISGMAYDPSGIQTIAFTLNGEQIQTLSEPPLVFSQTLDTTFYPNGGATLTVRATTKGEETVTDDRFVILENEDEDESGAAFSSSDDIFTFCLVSIIVSIIFIIAIVGSVAAKKQREKEQGSSSEGAINRASGYDQGYDASQRYPTSTGTATYTPPDTDKTAGSHDDRAKEAFLHARDAQLQKIYGTIDPEKERELEKMACWHCGREISIYDLRCSHCDRELR